MKEASTNKSFSETALNCIMFSTVKYYIRLIASDIVLDVSRIFSCTILQFFSDIYDKSISLFYYFHYVLWILSEVLFDNLVNSCRCYAMLESLTSICFKWFHCGNALSTLSVSTRNIWALGCSYSFRMKILGFQAYRALERKILHRITLRLKSRTRHSL